MEIEGSEIYEREGWDESDIKQIQREWEWEVEENRKTPLRIFDHAALPVTTHTAGFVGRVNNQRKRSMTGY